ncbi:hypothetical protein CSV80_13675 [Sporosarcina sp. P12(2017)]|uniref:hypothetical protein n=1 Tax=unclassified Sporosarcina TaxID=2647733 RepID=UPI000C17023E|nr:MULTISPECIES: hypothetical protein [unclassified Sporosarcina]PIC56718.1 hypothetical protein CSV81_13110 [Sporosarcina sp. P10]PIC59935.1 hypothetical protein CSV80_13675 [Sporosarcina sp. P12(2017)]
MKLLRKLIIAILSAIIFSLTLAFYEYTPSAKQQANVGYFPYDALFVLYFIYSIPIYLIGGIPYSHYVDIYFDKITFQNEVQKYIMHFLIYIAGGLLIVGILLLISLLIDGDVSGLLLSNIFTLGIFSSLVFFHISLLLNKVSKILAK